MQTFLLHVSDQLSSVKDPIIKVKDLDFVPIDDVHEALEHPSTQTASQKLPAATSSKAHDDKLRAEPRLLENGKWECNHNCKEKTKYGRHSESVIASY